MNLKVMDMKWLWYRWDFFDVTNTSQRNYDLEKFVWDETSWYCKAPLLAARLGVFRSVRPTLRRRLARGFRGGPHGP